MTLRIYSNARLATLVGPEPYGMIEDGLLAVEGETIVFAGSAVSYAGHADDIVDLEGRLVTPGLVDCHTHLVHGGSRASEFEMRLQGATYEEIARAGGGIATTVEATRQASDEELLVSALGRLDRMLAGGVTTVEIKSGYGLDRDTELRMLRVARQLSEERPVRVMTTFLGAHAIPEGQSSTEYLEQTCLPTLRQAASEGLVDAVDGFCEGIAFSRDEIEEVFKVAAELGLPVKLHAEQLSSLGGAGLAAKYGALSADHLEHACAEDIDAMATAGTIAVLLPSAFYFLKDEHRPPIDAFRDAGVAMAVATDCNPGSSPMTALPLAMNMAATFFGLTPEEALRGATVHGARALGLSDCGCLAAGQRADLAIWEADNPAELTYRMGDTPLFSRIFGGRTC